MMNPFRLWRPALFVIAGPAAAVGALLTGLPWWQAIGVGIFVSVAAGAGLFHVEAG